MCDTLVALGNATQDGSVIFAKNSDREPNEAHWVLTVPATDHPEGSVVQCTYIQVPQVRHTYAVLLSKPCWGFGAEMGANEHGVAIGNEAVFTRIPYNKEGGLTGMDLLRLALERSKSAEEALHTIIDLLETYGQGGNCGFRHPFYYHNGFLIADRREAWVLETVDRHWAAEKVQDVRSISNALSIQTRFDLASADLITYAVDRGWSRKGQPFNFAKAYTDPLITFFAGSAYRHQCTMDSLRQQQGRISPQTMMHALRAHRGDFRQGWRTDRALLGTDVCMHAGFGPVRINQTTGSMVSRLSDPLDTHWVTATAAPCTSLFKPVWIDSGLPVIGLMPQGEYDPETLWWRHERLHRAVIESYPERMAAFAADRDQTEMEMLAKAERLAQAPVDERRRFTEACFAQADECETEWLQRVRAVSGRKPAVYYRRAWEQFNREAKFTDF